MEKQSLWNKLSRKYFIPAGEEDFATIKEIFPFYALVTLVIIWIYFQVIKTSPVLEDPFRHTAFIFLLILHLVLYWMTLYFSNTPRRVYGYLFFQGILIFVIVLVTNSDTVVMSLFTSMIGNAIGILGKSKASLVAIVYYLVLAIISLAVVIVSPALSSMISVLVPVAAFTAFFAYFFSRQIEGRMEVTELLNNLEKAHQQLTEYTIRVEDLTLSNERQRIARELHDTLAQGLAGMILQLEAAVIHIEGQNSEKAKDIVEQAMARARTTLVDARKAIDDLRANLDTPQALTESIHAEVDRFRSTTGIPCTLNLSLPTQIDPHISEHILRTAAEGLWNIARHAEATQSALTVQIEGAQIMIEVEDNGIGFNPDDQVGKSGHYGLLGIRERVRLANGQFSVESAPGKGTKLRILLPIEPIMTKDTDE